MKRAVLIVALVLQASCGSETETQKPDHVWKEQTDALKKARGTINAAEQETIDQARRLANESD